MQGARKEARLLAYTSLCRPVLEYADVVWDPHVKSTIHAIEIVQNTTIRFIKHLKGREESVSAARDDLKLDSLEKRRKTHRLSLLLKILQDEDRHHALLQEYKELLRDRERCTIKTRAATRGEQNSLATNKTVYHQSFLPRTIRDLRLTNINTYQT